MNPVADGVDDLTPTWLSHALDADVRSATVERIGTGQTGATYRLTLDADEQPTTMVAKIAVGDDAARRRVAGGYRNEVGFYAQLVETLDVRTPRCWYAAVTDDALQFTLLLEDLAPRVPGVQADGCSLARAKRAVHNLAGLHAPRWGDTTLFDLDFLRAPSADGAAFLGAVTKSATDVFLDRYRADLEAEDVATLRDVAAAVESWLLARPEPFAVVHGDYRLDNLMFATDDADVVAVDWQTLAVAPPARDLAYFLGTSLSTDDRRAGEDDLVALYHAAVVARGINDYGAERCFDDYRLGQIQGPMITTIGAAYATAQRSERADGMFLAMARRTCVAIRDLRSLDLL